jgi:membrane protease YdiL (CAAX protease family)
VTKLDDRSRKWTWGDDRDGRGGSGSGSSADEPPAATWNPRTGFMKTRAQVEAEQRAAAAAAATAASTAAGAGTGSGASSSRSGGGPEPQAPAHASAAAAAAGAAAAPLAPVGKGQVLGSCIGTTAALGVLAFIIRAYAAQSASSVLGTDPDLLARLLQLPPGLGSAEDVAVMLAAAAAVTGARLLLLERWDDLRAATDRSNRQVLAPLNWGDVAVVALLSGTSEELLFRGALIPASFPDWRGVLLSAALFGALHNSGGRNAAFAAWAGAVGALYGAAYLYTENIWVAAGAHCLANFASAAIWIGQNGGVGRISSDTGAKG